MDGNNYTIPDSQLFLVSAAWGRWGVLWTCIHSEEPNVAVCPGCWKVKLFLQQDNYTLLLPISCCDRSWLDMDNFICFFRVPVSGFLFLSNIPSTVGLWFSVF